MHFLMTVDVESHSISLNREDPETVRQVHRIALPMLLSLLSRYDVAATFYFTGLFAEQSPESVELVMEHGHEIGCHGYDHAPEKALDRFGLEEQRLEVRKAKRTIESISGKVRSFRAPALRINEHTIRALDESGFSSDSSVCSQRFDGPFTFGSKRKLRWLFAPRKPYHPSYASPFMRGGAKLLEVPVSALIIPFIGTAMRISPTVTRRIIGRVLFTESMATGKPIVFLFHPNECLNSDRIETYRRASNLFEYVFADLIRQRLKLRNLGRVALTLLENMLKDASRFGFEFTTVEEFVKRCR